MNISASDPNQDPTGALRRSLHLTVSARSDQATADACRELDARGVKYSLVNGVPVVQQGFARAVKGENLFEQCLEMNRQAVVRGPSGPATARA